VESKRADARSAKAENSRWLTTFLFLTATLSSTILLKVGQIQYLELLYFVEIAVLVYLFSKRHYVIRWFRPYSNIASHYLIFSALVIILSLFSLRYDFYYPESLGILNYPVIITISRLVELFASVSIMLYLAEIFREDPKKAVFTMRVYFWAGIASAIYSILSFPLSFIGITLGTYSDSHRMRGFYNEGGPYGLYLISVFLVGLTLYSQNWVKRKFFLLSSFVLSIAFMGCQSKAAICAVLLMLLVNGLLVKSIAQRMTLVASLVVFIAIIYPVVDIGAAFRLYQRDRQAYELASHRHVEDGNFVYGRLAGAFVVPKMINAHPYVGVGLGNYGLVRNAPEYRGAAVFVKNNDIPGLGILGLAAELGLPLTIYLLACLLLPYFYLRKMKMPLYLTNLALLQPMVHLFGGQLNLTYPWIVTAFSLGMTGFLLKDDKEKI
jgi:hypothetical protein